LKTFTPQAQKSSNSRKMLATTGKRAKKRKTRWGGPHGRRGQTCGKKGGGGSHTTH